MTELWTTAQAAHHWGVSESRARAILAEAGLRSGYDADAVRAIRRPGQGARTDLKETVMESLSAAARQLVFSGAFASTDEADAAIDAFVKEHGLYVTAEREVDRINYEDIVHELKG